MKKLIPMIGVAAFALGAFAETPGLLVAEEPMSFEAGETGVTEVPGLFDFTSPVTLDEVDYNLWFSSSAVSDGTAKVKAYEGSVGYTYPTEGEAVRNPALAGAGSSSYLAVETAKNSPLYRTLNGNNGELAAVALTTNVYVDTLVQFTGFEEPQSITAGKIAVWMSAIEAEGTPAVPGVGDDPEDPDYRAPIPASPDYVQGETNLYVSCGAINGEGDANATNIKIVKDGLEVGKWYRLTVKAVDGIFTDAGVTLEGLEQRLGFVVYIDGQAVGYACTAAEKNSVIDEAVAAYLTTDAKALWNAGLLFPALEAGVSLAAVGFEGTGSVDDLVIDDVGPEFAWAIPEPPASDVTFTVPAIANATVVAKVDGVALVPNADGSYTVPADTLVTIEVTPNEGYKVNHNTMNVTPTDGEELDVNEFQVTEKGFILLIADGEEVNDYTNLVDAATAATEGATVLVTKNFALEANTVISEKDLTLDLGGNTIDLGANTLTLAGCTTVLTNGTITGTAAEMFYVEGGTINVYATLSNTNTSQGYALTVANTADTVINVYDGAEINVTEGYGIKVKKTSTINVYGGHFVGWAGIQIHKANNESVLNVYAGTFDGKYGSISVTNEAGTSPRITPLTDDCEAKFKNVDAYASVVSIADICAEGYAPVLGEDGYYTIQEKAAPTTYAITIAEGIVNGTVSADKTEAEAGATVTLTVNPDDGYQIASVTTNSVAIEAVEGAYSFVMPAEAVTVAATFELIPPTTYAITIAEGIVNGTVAADKATAAAGETITLTVTPADGYQIASVTTNGTALAAAETYTFVMPAQAVEVAATFELIPPTTYAISIAKADNGTVTADKTEAEAGATVTLTVTPATDYVIDTVTTNGAELAAVEGAYTFTMPAEAVTVAATFKAAGKTYPSYIPDNADIKAKFDKWAEDYGRDAEEVNMDAFLLDCAPAEVATEKAKFVITSIEQNADGTWTVKAMNQADGTAYKNGFINIKPYTLTGAGANAAFFQATLVVQLED